MESSSFNADDIYLFEECMSREYRMIMDAIHEYAQTQLDSRTLMGNQDERLFHSILQLY